MGFVVDNHINESSATEVSRQNQALVYGKAEYMWDVSSYMEAIDGNADLARCPLSSQNLLANASPISGAMTHSHDQVEICGGSSSTY